MVRNGHLVGVVSRADILRALATRDAPEATSSTDDRALREKVIAEIDQTGTNAHVNPIVENGVVHLWGVVDSDSDRRAVCLAAERMPGVKAVEDHLGRRPPYGA